MITLARRTQSAILCGGYLSHAHTTEWRVEYDTIMLQNYDMPNIIPYIASEKSVACIVVYVCVCVWRMGDLSVCCYCYWCFLLLLLVFVGTRGTSYYVLILTD